MGNLLTIKLRDIYFARNASDITTVMDTIKMGIGKFPKRRTLRI